VSAAPWLDEPPDEIDLIGSAPRAIPADLRALSWDELMAEPADPPPMLAPGIPEVGVTVVAGSPKVGKTLWAGQMALESGRPALLVIEEGSLAGIAYRLRRQADELGIARPLVEVLHRKRIRLDERRSVAMLRSYVETTRPALVIVDPLNRLHSADENRPTQMTPVMDALAEIAYDCACAVLAIHHLAKPSAERRGDIWDRFRGASSIRSGTDANLVLDGTGDRIRLVGEFRDAEPLTEWLELDRDALLFRHADAPEAPAKVDPIALREYVADRGQVTGKQIVERFSVSRNTAFAALRALGCDEFAGVRGVLTFSIGTGQ
jgi:hypothetical protein